MKLLEPYFTGTTKPALFYYGWMVVAASFICHMFIFGIPTVMLPLIYGPMGEQFGWSRGDVVILASAKFTAGAVAAFFVGQFIQRYGVKLTAFLSSLIVGFTMIGFLLITELWHLTVIGSLLGVGSISLVICVKVIVSRWFEGRLGLALGLALLGSAAAGSLLTFVLEPLIEGYGWRMAVAILSAGVWFIALPVFMLIAREHPEEMGLKTDGIDTDPGKIKREMPDHFMDFAAIVRGKTFIAMSIGIFLIGFVDQGMLQHTVEYIDKEAGLGRDLARYGFSLVFTISIFGKIGFGWLFDKLAIKGVMICYIMIGIGVLLAFPIGGFETLLAFCVARGLSHGGTIVDVPYLARQAYGPALLPRTIGTLTMILSCGFALGPYVMGRMYDSTGSYDSAFYLCMVMAGVATVSLMFVRPAYREWLREQAPQ
ncbi:MAG: MFS transporter [Kordiimonadaceae bacterium]|nr:MFS transporter [Kordiimonadaceae bacterium]MBT6330041.1 MFS transporter [Kordiimonadaceae bacterium]